jgi:hypothetical protein
VIDLAVADMRKDLDYAAYILCLADLKLDAPRAPAAAAPHAAPDSAPH